MYFINENFNEFIRDNSSNCELISKGRIDKQMLINKHTSGLKEAEYIVSIKEYTDRDNDGANNYSIYYYYEVKIYDSLKFQLVINNEMTQIELDKNNLGDYERQLKSVVKIYGSEDNKIAHGLK